MSIYSKTWNKSHTYYELSSNTLSQDELIRIAQAAGDTKIMKQYVNRHSCNVVRIRPTKKEM